MKIMMMRIRMRIYVNDDAGDGADGADGGEGDDDDSDAHGGEEGDDEPVSLFSVLCCFTLRLFAKYKYLVLLI